MHYFNFINGNILIPKITNRFFGDETRRRLVSTLDEFFHLLYKSVLTLPALQIASNNEISCFNWFNIYQYCRKENYQSKKE